MYKANNCSDHALRDGDTQEQLTRSHTDCSPLMIAQSEGSVFVVVVLCVDVWRKLHSIESELLI